MKTKSAPTIIEARLKGLRLLTSCHKCPDDGLCGMEAAAWIVDAPHSDRPETACPVIGAIVRPWNDRVDDETRQLLVPLLPRIALSKSTRAVEKKRAWHFADVWVRQIVPGLLDEFKFPEQAASLRALEKICDEITGRRSRPVISSVANFLRTAASSTSSTLSQRELLGRVLDRVLGRVLDLDLVLGRVLDRVLDLVHSFSKRTSLVYLPTLKIIEDALAITE